MTDITKFPQLIVFDFHGVLTRPQSDTKAVQKQLKINKPEGRVNYYNLMISKNPDVNYLMPTLDEIAYFIRYVQRVSPNTRFGVASVGENEAYIIDMLRYCFERADPPLESPFNESNVVANFMYARLDRDAKVKLREKGLSKSKILQINYICEQSGIDPPGCEAVLLDDRAGNIKQTLGVCGMLVEPIYFRVDIWNRNAPACHYSQVPPV